MSSRLVPAQDEHAGVVAGWSRSADEARRWCSAAEHPFPPERVRGWWAGNDVRPWVLVEGSEAEPVGYGGLWLDDEEVELAVTDVEELAEQVAAAGPDALVLAPDDLREAVLRRLRGALAAADAHATTGEARA